GRVLLDELLRLPRDKVHGFVPGRLDQLAVALDERCGEAIRTVVRLPSVHTLGAEPPVVHAIDAAAANADDAAVLHADVHTAAVGAEHACGLDPALRLLGHVLVDADRPLAGMRRPRSPDVSRRVAVTHCLGAGADDVPTRTRHLDEHEAGTPHGVIGRGSLHFSMGQLLSGRAGYS